MIYLVIANLPRQERYKLENIIIIGVIPGPHEPQKHINSFLKPLVDELLVMWNGCFFRSSHSGVVPVRCALICITCDLPATRKSCGFTSYSSLHGCSKCMKEFPGTVFTEKSDYSGYDRETWSCRKIEDHRRIATLHRLASTKTKRTEIEKKIWCSNLQYFDIVEYHVVDPMHNLLLGTAKYLMTLWKESKLLSKQQFENIQAEVDDICVPAEIGRIPHKIASNFSGFTADQWKNWVSIFSVPSLQNILPSEHFNCWLLFQEATNLILQPFISLSDLKRADEKLVNFCQEYEKVYGKSNCTPNMHMHLHLRKCIENYGPSTAFWCFPFERFNGIMGRFQNNWISPEQQMAHKFLAYQDLLTMELSKALPKQLNDFFDNQLTKYAEISLGEGSLEQSHIDSLSVVNYSKNSTCGVNEINAVDCTLFHIGQKYEKYFDHDEVTTLSEVYSVLYPDQQLHHVPMVHERFYEVKVFNMIFLSSHARGNQSAAVCAYWAGIGGNLLEHETYLRVGVLQYFFKHSVHFSSPCSLVAHFFAKVHWYERHPNESWFHKAIIVQPCMNKDGAASIIPISRIYSRCAILSKTVDFEYGTDKVIVAIPCDIH